MKWRNTLNVTKYFEILDKSDLVWCSWNSLKWFEKKNNNLKSIDCHWNELKSFLICFTNNFWRYEIHSNETKYLRYFFFKDFQTEFFETWWNYLKFMCVSFHVISNNFNEFHNWCFKSFHIFSKHSISNSMKLFEMNRNDMKRFEMNRNDMKRNCFL